jgi:hypothetical protein
MPSPENMLAGSKCSRTSSLYVLYQIPSPIRLCGCVAELERLLRWLLGAAIRRCSRPSSSVCSASSSLRHSNDVHGILVIVSILFHRHGACTDRVEVDSSFVEEGVSRMEES